MRLTLPFPASLRWVIAVFVWLGSAAAAWWLYRGQATGASAVAIAQSKEFRVAATQVGRLVTLEVAEGQRVVPGQVMARMETGPIEQAIAIAEAQAIEAASAIPATGAALDAGALQVERNFRGEIEAASIEANAARADAARDNGELAKLREDIRREKALVERGLTRSDRLRALEARFPALDEAVKAWPLRIQAIEVRHHSTVRRLEEWARGRERAPLQLAPFEARARQRKEAVRLLRSHAEQTVLRAIAHAYVSLVHARAGDVLRPGTPVVTLVEANPKQVIAYVDERRWEAVPLGTRVTARRRAAQEHSYDAIVSGIAADVTELPRRLWTNPHIPAWGRALYITLPESATLAPGELVDVVTHSQTHAGTFVPWR